MKPFEGRESRGKTMENAGFQRKSAGTTASAYNAMWNPFWFMHQVLGWGRSSHAPSLHVKEADAPAFDVKEADGTYVCKVKLTLPERADVTHARAELDNGELTLVVPKASAAQPGLAVPRVTPAKLELVPKAEAPKPEPPSPPRRTRRATGKGGGPSGRKPRRGRRTRVRRRG